MTKMMHNIEALEACYDRQLESTCMIVYEHIGFDWVTAKLITKFLLMFEHYVCTSFRVSEEIYGWDREILGGQHHVGKKWSVNVTIYLLKY